VTEELQPGATLEAEILPAPKRDPAWGYREIAFVVAIFVASLMLCLTVGVLVAGSLPLFRGVATHELGTNPLFFVPVQFLAYLLTFTAARLAVVSVSGEAFWPSIHWNLPGAERIFAYLLAGALLALAVLLLSTLLPFPKSLPMQQYFREPRFAYVMAAFGLAVAPLAEEIFFRGLLYPVFVRTMGQTSAIIVTGLMFSLMHQGQLARAWAPLLVLFGVGIALTLVRARTNSVAASWIMHVGYNGTLFATMFYFSEGFRKMT